MVNVVDQTERWVARAETPTSAVTGNLRAAPASLGHRKIESSVRYLGIEVDDALAIAEQIDV